MSLCCQRLVRSVSQLDKYVRCTVGIYRFSRPFKFNILIRYDDMLIFGHQNLKASGLDFLRERKLTVNLSVCVLMDAGH